ncbi:uncharacterized protein pdgfbb isoform X2 [Hippocampus zosterae]|uniref:uncharacterized protein pdgfbb isoform X2 n=1 Tax=Hippocampus zosterae TaxID=109293 RepID=UPI00223E19D9|nr:uncharacterized protein pdgfbb isoform X2 [Hippocampus zosterae]
MSSTAQLLLALLATCVRLGAAEGDPLPAALVELVRNSPISSIEDLQLLLLTDSVDEEERNGGRRLPRSLAQPAQQAVCKVRTEVVEVTRAMLDRSNANFLLWPPCVEVQRCSGCCNTKSLQCVPVVTHTRYLQVMKIEYVNKRPTYAKAVVSVMDHVECRCQPAPQQPAPRRKSSRRHHGHKDQHRNRTLGQGRGQVKVHTKDELHQWDELKQNQGSLLVDLLEQHWSPRGDTFNQPGEGYSVATSLPEEDVLLGSHWTRNSTGFRETKSQKENKETKERMPKGNATLASVDPVGINKTLQDGQGLSSPGGIMMEGPKGGDEGTQIHRPSWQEEKATIPKPVTQKPQAKWNPIEETVDRFGSKFRPTKEPNPDPPREETRWRGNKTPEEENILQIAEKRLEEERKELLLLHKRLDQEKEILKQQQKKREEEQHHLRSRHRYLQTTTTTTCPETTTAATKQQPSAPARPRPPVHPRRRMRKNRKRISKAAMRAMLM